MRDARCTTAALYILANVFSGGLRAPGVLMQNAQSEQGIKPNAKEAGDEEKRAKGHAGVCDRRAAHMSSPK